MSDLNLRRLPAEWEPQDAILLAWPDEKTDWGPTLDSVQKTYLEIIKQTIHFQRVIIVVQDKSAVEGYLASAGCDLARICLVEVPFNDTWVRDSGPLGVYNAGKPELLNFTFNGWGNKFAAGLDNQLNQELSARGIFGTTPMSSYDLVLEGGSIESDGLGTLLTTASCLLEKNRNPHLTRQQIDSHLREVLGAQKVLWLDAGQLSGDDTDGHIDTLVRFAPDNRMVFQGCNDSEDPHFEILQGMVAQLKEFRTCSQGIPVLLELPWPQPISASDGQRLPATYANFLVLNGAVLAPTYADPADAEALRVIGLAFPEREIIGIDCRPLLEQHGSLHCITMQIPKGVMP